MRVLLQLAGTRRNAGGGRRRPALRLARAKPDGRAFHEVEIVGDLGAPASLEIAAQLVRDLGRSRRRPHPRLREAPGLAHVPSRVQPPMAEVADEVLERHRGHLDGLRVDVSVESGTPAQQMALVRALEDRGVEVGLVLLDEAGGAIRLDVAPRRDPARHLARFRDPERMLEHLRHLPPGRTVLLTGPTGVGKTRLATRLHEVWKEQAKRSGPFVPVNCAAIPDNLLESELFGHVRGAFTGANADKRGALEAAKNGTAFLDEVGELPLALQAKLLTALDHDVHGVRRFSPVGSPKPRTTDARLVLATNRDLDRLVREGRFRDDLLARISAHVVELPSLRERPHRALSAYLEALEAIAPQLGGATPFLEHPAWHRLVRFAFDPTSTWRWNFRDVRQSAERLALRTWGKHGYPAESDEPLRVDAPTLEIELEELRRRWADAEPRPTAEDEWAPLRRALAPGAMGTLSRLEQWEARFLLDARRATSSNAEAWRWLQERRLLPAPRGPSTNPSAAFSKRWAKFRWSADRGS